MHDCYLINSNVRVTVGVLTKKMHVLFRSKGDGAQTGIFFSHISLSNTISGWLLIDRIRVSNSDISSVEFISIIVFCHDLSKYILPINRSTNDCSLEFFYFCCFRRPHNKEMRDKEKEREREREREKKKEEENTIPSSLLVFVCTSSFPSSAFILFNKGKL
jgi:hypothetical protein